VFRGLFPLNLINCLAAINTKLVPGDSGKIHEGFFTGSLPVLRILRQLLLSWSSQTSPRSLADILWDLVDASCAPAEIIQNALGSGRMTQSSAEPAVSPEISIASAPKPALYICGHSVGGALASMTGAMLLHPTLKPVRAKLRSIYSFGAPMFADAAYAETLEKELGERVFLHRYGNDMITLLPGRRRGIFKHFGREYVNSKEGRWVRQIGNDKSVTWSGIVVLIGFVALLKETAAVLPKFPLPYSFTDHYPLHYLRTSQGPQAGWELLGWEPAGA
jgi:hypothetical protein